MSKRVVITGIGAVSPNGTGREAYKTAILEGRPGIRRISAFDPSALTSRIAGEIHLGGNGFSKKEERNLPRVVQFALMASGEALEDAGIDPKKMRSEERARFGVLLGTGGGSIEFTERHYQMVYGKRPFQPSLYAIPASTAGGISGELSIRFGLRGRSHVISTGCTSSTDAIGYGFHEIRTGRLQRVLAGGSDAPITEGVMTGFELMKILSTHWNHEPAKASRPFAKDRDGFVLAEGAWMFILEEKEHAESRGVRPYAEILGYGASCEAFHAVRLDEKGDENFLALGLACEEAGVPAEGVDYVNLHGTSTLLNDRIETRTMKKFFGERAARIPMSSTKSMIGHPQGASGAAGLAATVLAMRAKKIHPTINLDHPDPDCNLDYVPNQSREWEIEHALCHTLGFGSRSSALVIRNCP